MANHRSLVLSKTILYTSALLPGIVWVLRSPCAYWAIPEIRCTPPKEDVGISNL